MKSQLTGTNPAAAEAAPSLQEELVAAIHGAFDVAVEIAVREVKRLVGRAPGDKYEEMRRENESLKQRLLTAEAMLKSARAERGGWSSPPSKQLTSGAKAKEQQLHTHSHRASPQSRADTAARGGRGDAPPANQSSAPHPEPAAKRVSGAEEEKSGHAGKTQCVHDPAPETHKERDSGCGGGMWQFGPRKGGDTWLRDAQEKRFIAQSTRFVRDEILRVTFIQHMFS